MVPSGSLWWHPPNGAQSVRLFPPQTASVPPVTPFIPPLPKAHHDQFQDQKIEQQPRKRKKSPAAAVAPPDPFVPPWPDANSQFQEQRRRQRKQSRAADFVPIPYMNPDLFLAHHNQWVPEPPKRGVLPEAPFVPPSPVPPHALHHNQFQNGQNEWCRQRRQSRAVADAAPAPGPSLMPPEYQPFLKLSNVCVRFLTHRVQLTTVPAQADLSYLPGFISSILYRAYGLGLDTWSAYGTLLLFLRLQTYDPVFRVKSISEAFLVMHSVAVKQLAEGVHRNNASWASAGQVCVRKFNRLEVDFVTKMEWDLNLTGSMLWAFRKRVNADYSSRSLGGSPDPYPTYLISSRLRPIGK